MSSIFLGNINPGSVNNEMAQACVRAATDGAVSHVWLKKSPPYLDIHRNIVVATFLEETDLDKLLFVDSDIVFTTEDIRALDETGLDCVSGWYRNPCPDGTLKPVVYTWGPRKESNGAHTSTVQYDDFMQVDALPEVQPRVSRVAAAGTGFLMISRDLLADMSGTFGLPQPWFIEQAVQGGPGEDPVWHGEDLLFGLRAHQMGVGWHVHKDVHLKHHKDAII